MNQYLKTKINKKNIKKFISKWSTSDLNAVARLVVSTSGHSSCDERLSAHRSLGTNFIVAQAHIGSLNRDGCRSYFVMIKITNFFTINRFVWNYIWCMSFIRDIISNDKNIMQIRNQMWNNKIIDSW